MNSTDTLEREEMKSLIYLTVFLCIAYALITISTAVPTTDGCTSATCPTNEVCRSVRDTLCPYSCANYTRGGWANASCNTYNTGRKICVCNYPHVYIDDRLNRCVHKDECKSIGAGECQRKANAEYKCIRNCSPTRKEPNIGNTVCWQRVCQPGCYCKSGYLEHPTGRCVLQKDCSKSG